MEYRGAIKRPSETRLSGRFQCLILNMKDINVPRQVGRMRSNVWDIGARGTPVERARRRSDAFAKCFRI
eukprot:6182896-Pleurochrysis_carterae.AAC.3